MDQTRHERGLETLAALDPAAAKRLEDNLRDIAPDFARYVVEFAFGEIYSRPHLDLRSRQIATIAALTALGNARPQLEVHLRAGLKAGLGRDQIVEILIQTAVYAGFPAAINALTAARAVFSEKQDEKTSATPAGSDRPIN